MHFLLLFLLLVSSSGSSAFREDGWIRPDAFYGQLVQEHPPGPDSPLQAFVRSDLRRQLREPLARSLLDIVDSRSRIAFLAEQRDLLQKLLQNRFFSRLSRFRFRFLRDGFLRISRGVEGTRRLSLREMALSSLPALLTRIEFQPLVGALQEIDSLGEFLATAEALQALRSEYADLKLLSGEFEGTAEQAAVALMRSAQNMEAPLLDSARLLRDARTVQRLHSSDFKTIRTRFADGLDLLLQLVAGTEVASRLHEVWLSGDLDKVFKESEKLESQWIQDQVSETATAIQQPLNATDLQSLVNRLHFRQLMDWQNSRKLARLEENGLLELVLQHVDGIREMFQPPFGVHFDRLSENLEDLAALQERQDRRKSRALEEKKACLRSMRLLMLARERYNLQVREKIRLSEADSKRKLHELADDPPPCPAGGTYHSTPGEWIYCTLHGRAGVPEHE